MKSTVKKIKKGRGSFVSWKNCTFKENVEQGTRKQDAWFCCFMLRVLSRRKKKIRKTGTYVDLIIPMMLAAWRTQDAEFFEDITYTLKRSNTDVAASPAAQKLLWDYFDVHNSKKKNYSLGEIMKICGINNKRQAGRIRESFNKWVTVQG